MTHRPLLGIALSIFAFGVSTLPSSATQGETLRKDFCPIGHSLDIAAADYDPEYGKLLVRGDADSAVTLSVLAADSDRVIASMMSTTGSDWRLLLEGLDRDAAPARIVAWTANGCRAYADVSLRRGGW